VPPFKKEKYLSSIRYSSAPFFYESEGGKKFLALDSKTGHIFDDRQSSNSFPYFEFIP